MALTIAADSLEGGQSNIPTVGDLVRGAFTTALIKVTFDSSYPTGGETIDLSNYFSSVLGAVCLPGALTYYIVYDVANSKIVAYTRATDAEVADTTDLSAYSAWMWVLGYR